MSEPRLSNKEFLNRVREYLTAENAIHETDESSQASEIASLADLEENNFYALDSEAVIAFTHAIQDFAMEQASGRLLASMQDCTQFEGHRDCYSHLAATLDDVELICAGKLAKRVNKLNFCHDAKELLKKFWIVLYEGRSTSVMLLCEEVNNATTFESKQFCGFYTFNQRVVAQARADISESLAGECPGLKRFVHLQKVDAATKKVKIQFARETDAVDIAIKRLRKREKNYRTQDFLDELNQALERLNALEAELRENIVEGKH
ncbi:MAG: DICT sensory domain-containing protein [Verrucomicrobiota bacterium]